MPDDSPNFADLVASDKWKTLHEHLIEISHNLEADLKTQIAEDKQLALKLRTEIEKSPKMKISRPSSQDLEIAQGRLYRSEVCAVDGTCAKFPMLSGIRCQIGIVATSYRNQRTEQAIYVSERHYRRTSEDYKQILQNRKSENRLISNIVIKAIMMYQERKIALDRPEKWKITHGSLLPFELRTGLGELRALKQCLSLLADLVENERIMAIQSESTHDELTSLGCALRSGEYMRLEDERGILEDYLESAGFNPEDRSDMEGFIRKYGPRIALGILRVGDRPYVFEAHVDHFDEAAAILIRDAMHQPLKGFPMLVDYADSLCSNLLSASEFRQRIEHHLMKSDALYVELSERSMRQR